MSSATASAFLPGVVTTGTPRLVAAATSMLTGPPRAQQIEPQPGGRAEDCVGHRRALDDEHLVVVERGDDLVGASEILAQPAL